VVGENLLTNKNLPFVSSTDVCVCVCINKRLIYEMNIMDMYINIGKGR
jgi:hypothetical protein